MSPIEIAKRGVRDSGGDGRSWGLDCAAHAHSQDRYEWVVLFFGYRHSCQHFVGAIGGAVGQFDFEVRCLPANALIRPGNGWAVGRIEIDQVDHDLIRPHTAS